jgi:hypothetical protein
LSRRETALDRELLLEVVRCGRPATRMPYHDRNAYKSVDCYGGMTKADLGADYVIREIQGKAEPTYDDCVAFWGEGNRECAGMR